MFGKTAPSGIKSLTLFVGMINRYRGTHRLSGRMRN